MRRRRSFSCSPSVTSFMMRRIIGSSSVSEREPPVGRKEEQTVCSRLQSCFRWNSYASPRPTTLTSSMRFSTLMTLRWLSQDSRKVSAFSRFRLYDAGRTAAPTTTAMDRSGDSLRLLISNDCS